MILEYGGFMGEDAPEGVRGWGLYKIPHKSGRAEFSSEYHLYDLVHPKSLLDRRYLWTDADSEMLSDLNFLQERYRKKSLKYRLLSLALLAIMFLLLGWVFYGATLLLVSCVLAAGLCLLFACMEIYAWRILRKRVDYLNERSADSVPLSADTIDLIRLLAECRDAEEVICAASDRACGGLNSYYHSKGYGLRCGSCGWYSDVHKFILGSQEFLDRLISREEQYIRLIDEELHARSSGKPEYFMSDELFFDLLMELKGAVDREYEPVRQREIAKQKAREQEEKDHRAKLEREQEAEHQKSIQEASSRESRAKSILNSSETPSSGSSSGS